MGKSSTRVRVFFTATPPEFTAAMAATLPADVSVALEIAGPGGGAWTVVRHGPSARLVSGIVEPWDCYLKCADHDFEALLLGTLDYRQGYLDGRLQVEGDVGLVMKLHQALRRTLPADAPPTATEPG